jgi:hypothetical protein
VGVDNAADLGTALVKIEVVRQINAGIEIISGTSSLQEKST